MPTSGNILPVDDADDEYVRVKQDTFFLACDKRGYSRTVLSERSGIEASTLGTYCSTPSRKSSIMSLAKMRRLIRIVPPELANILVDGTGLHFIADDPRSANWLAIGAKAAELASEICIAAADGIIDHMEEPRLREKAVILIGEAEGQVRG